MDKVKRALHVALSAGLLCLLCHAAAWPQAAEEKTPEAATPAPAATTAPAEPDAPTAEEQESELLKQAVQSAEDNPQALIKNLEDFLTRFPQSTQRERVLRLIFRKAMQANDQSQAIAAAERLLEIAPDDPGVLYNLTDLLSRQGDTASRGKALDYATRFIECLEKKATEPKPPDASAEEWRMTQAALRATGFRQRAKVEADLGRTDAALADLEKSYAALPMASTAERMGDLCSARGDAERAIDYYATAFAFPEKSLDPAHLNQVRRKLSSAYLLRHSSEQGLGELILERYDELAAALHSRWNKEDKANKDARDPFDFVLQRPDGSDFRLADYRGKVVVMDFWATWCGPCRVEGKIMHQLAEMFKDEPGVAFLAVNAGEDCDTVSAFVKEENWTIPTVLAQNLDSFLQIRGLPTLVIFDRQGRVVFRQEGVAPTGFSESIVKAVRKALAPPVEGADPAS